ncbi:MAG: serine/threonine-protein kinase [Myxococcales bacterium]|nr:serine/threonine-protein kinase [Myxococcales bacterium]
MLDEAMTTLPSEPGDLIGGRYRVVRELGRGGMGNVYEAENLRTGRRVALKTMRASALGARAEMVGRFEREARAAGQLRHPNVVDVIDLGDDPERGLLFIVQELLEGGDLGQCLRTVGTLAPHAAVATLLPVMDALSAAHARGVFHRDIKPDNIFLHEAGGVVVPKVIDFGIAKVTLAETDPSHSVTGEMVGSPNYVSPEQARGDRDVDGRADVWSLGMVFYKCLSASVAYAAPTTSMLLAKIIYEEPTPLATLAPGLPRDLVAVIQKAVTKDREGRWASMADFSDALRGCVLWRDVDAAQAQRWVVDARGVSAQPAAPAEAFWAVAPAEADDAPEVSWPETSEPWRGEVAVATDRRRGGRWTALAALAVALVAGAVAAWPGEPARATRAAAVVRVATRAPAAERGTAAVATERGTAAAPRAEGATADAGVAAAVARATAPRELRRVAPTIRRGQREAPRRPAAAAAATSPRGFNGSPIIE